MNCWNRERADRLRAIPLAAVLPLCGGEPDRHDTHKWQTPVGTLSICGAKFMNWSRGVGGGGAIDLVMHLKSLRFVDALDWLGRQFAGSTLPVMAAPIQTSTSTLQLPPPHADHLRRVRRYLTEQRRLAPATIDQLIASGVLYADARANAVFLLLGLGKKNIPVGAELRGTTERQWRGMAPGSHKDRGFFSVVVDPRLPAASIILCESAIDAISCALLHQGHRCLSTSGARPNPAWLAPLLAQSSAIYCGFDADPTGDQMAGEMMTLHPAVKRLRPSLHDWNDVLGART